MLETLTPAYIKRLQRLNCRLSIGLQSIDPEVHKLAGRPFHIEEFTKKAQILSKNNIEFYLDTIIGMEGSSYQDVIDTFNYAFSLNPFYVGIRALMLRKGTFYSRELKAKGFISGVHPRLGTIEQVIQTPLILEKDILHIKQVWMTYKQLYQEYIRQNNYNFQKFFKSSISYICKITKKTPWNILEEFNKYLSQKGYVQNVYKLEYEPTLLVEKEWKNFCKTTMREFDSLSRIF